MNKPDFPIAISNTIREAFVNCPQKAYWEFFRRLKPATPNIHLHAGGAFAKALETARRAFYEQGKAEDEAVQVGEDMLITTYGTFDADNGYLESSKSLSNLLRAYTDYFFEYPLSSDAFTPVITADGKAGLEFSFAIPTSIRHPQTGDPILYAGKFDMLAKRGDEFWIVDEKTTSQLGQTWNSQWDLNSQFTGYCMAARNYGYPVQGAIIRGVGLLKTKISHQQAIVYRPEWQIDRWWKQLHRDIQMMVALYEADPGDGSQFDFSLGAACSNYGACPYKNLCLSNQPEVWAQNLVPSDYNPLSVHEKD